ncbi:hypothetical protein [Hymenobacter siberiensis]|jgi:hypothetical protein|uniref:hypothetical protein n=1 Tax=Hymenobacter siberiensis TaxID=2848396 RepID=UPI001C1DE482|nr:hypothetical protein [Hymenobacter siberiensis]MBU6121894.1 hypothetical protein [Hymenobacter siberiensis]
MDLKTLEEALIAGRFRGWYLNGGLPNETYTIGKTTRGWEVYYSERGQKSNLKIFTSESEACKYFWDTIGGDSEAV